MMDHERIKEIDRVIAELPFQEQLRLLARIGERLAGAAVLTDDEESTARLYREQVNDFLELSDEGAVVRTGEVDSASEIRSLREEGVTRL